MIIQRVPITMDYYGAQSTSHERFITRANSRFFYTINIHRNRIVLARFLTIPSRNSPPRITLTSKTTFSRGFALDEKSARRSHKKTYSSDSATPPCTADKTTEQRRISTDSSTYLLEVPTTLPSVAVSAATGPAALSKLCRINVAGNLL